MVINSLKEMAEENGIILKHSDLIVEEASKTYITDKKMTAEIIKENFDSLFKDIEKEAYKIYLKYEKEYGQQIWSCFIENLIKEGIINDINSLPDVLSQYFNLFDKFYLSLAQSRKARSGKTFENITKSLFKMLNYPFDEQIIINGKPDFLMPSETHYRENPMDCLIFTAKRTLRERWRQIVTEGTRGLGFYLATIDQDVSGNQLREMLNHRIYMVCPLEIKNKCYNNKVNVISFKQFFKDILDPAIIRWKDNGVII